MRQFVIEASDTLERSRVRGKGHRRGQIKDCLYRKNEKTVRKARG